MNRIKVIVADDELFALNGISGIIEKSDDFCVVGKAANGQSALQMILKEKPQIVVTDIKMPLMDGLHLIDECKRRKLQVAFIVISAYDEGQYVRSALKSAVVYDYLFKPFANEDLINALHGSYKFYLKMIGQLESDDTGLPLLLDAINDNDYQTVEGYVDDVFSYDEGSFQELKNRCYGWIIHVHNSTFANDKIRSFESYPTTKKVFEAEDREELKNVIKKYLKRCCESYNRNENITVLVKSCLKILESEYENEDFNLNYCADKLAVTPNYLAGRFSRDMGVSFSNYLNQKRLNRAKELLNDVSLKVYEVASMVGISDVAYFNKLFKDSEGVTPSQYRRSSLTGDFFNEN